VVAKPRLEADRAKLARFVGETARCADDATAAVLRALIDQLAEELERHR
jgi:hypothetical protein